MFVVLKNELCCYKQIPPWTKGLTNYFYENWLCNANTIPKLIDPLYLSICLSLEG